ncbi:glutamyl-tRNA reductase [bacterium]|nr:glutamyl-tRNA reductase [Candidatus Omnitrophota bacterium]MBU3929311.1 glutamyl-tRNA reductase [bacterium]MBU4122484.1 glutamyl-tRNA reductase [bacterium]
MITCRSKDLKHSLEERERYYSGIKLPENNAVMLHTCNRIELYHGEGFAPEDVVRHLFRVVSSLESAIIGETAIQAQVRAAYENARNTSRLSAEMHRLFQHTLKVGKRIRTQTNISKGAMSHAYAVIEILKQDNIDISTSGITIIGVSNLNESVIKYFSGKGNQTIFIANRTYNKALEMGKKYGCETVKFGELPCAIGASDIVVSATSAPHLIIKKGDLIKAGNITLFDLAVPRDIDPEIALMRGVSLYNIEDIEKRIALNKNIRSCEIKKVEKIIETEISRFYALS